jgi:hypothetical protein
LVKAVFTLPLQASNHCLPKYLTILFQYSTAFIQYFDHSAAVVATLPTVVVALPTKRCTGLANLL